MGCSSPITGAEKSRTPMLKANSKGNYFLHSSGRGRSLKLLQLLILEREYRDLGELGASGLLARSPRTNMQAKVAFDFF
jgi:hypothetical protein